jgi:hypothetical protein
MLDARPTGHTANIQRRIAQGSKLQDVGRASEGHEIRKITRPTPGANAHHTNPGQKSPRRDNAMPARDTRAQTTTNRPAKRYVKVHSSSEAADGAGESTCDRPRTTDTAAFALRSAPSSLPSAEPYRDHAGLRSANLDLKCPLPTSRPRPNPDPVRK